MVCMPVHVKCILLLLLGSLAGCSMGRQLPKYEKRMAMTDTMKIRTTAYTHTESDHIRHSNRNALGTELKCGPVNSAAADWSRFPAGTIFQIRATGEIFEVDDYGWALAGTNTIDLYKPSRALMNEWGVRRVTIDILRWGDARYCHKILKPREKYQHVKRMTRDLERYCL